jgi:hypothetical protein
MMDKHPVAGVYVDAHGDPIEGRLVFTPVTRGVASDRSIVLPLPVTVELIGGAAMIDLPASGEGWWWEVIEPDGGIWHFQLDGPFDLASLEPTPPPYVQVVGPQGAPGRDGLTVLPDTGWRDVRANIVAPFQPDTGERAAAQIRRYGNIVSLRLNARYAGDGTSHRFGTPTNIFDVPAGFREWGWTGAVGSGVANQRVLEVGMAHPSTVLTVVDVTSTQSLWTAAQHVTLTATWVSDDPHPAGTHNGLYGDTYGQRVTTGGI